MAYRVQFELGEQSPANLQQLGNVDQVIAPIMDKWLRLIKEHAVQNLSGVPFTSDTGTWTINKRSGMGAASVQAQYPYGSPFKGRIFANAYTKYADNPETYNYLKILEVGRGPIRPKYTPSMQNGNPGAAQLAVPGGPHQLVSGQGGFRGITGRYRFVKEIPAAEGRYWLKSAIANAKPSMDAIAQNHLQRLIDGKPSY